MRKKRKTSCGSFLENFLSSKRMSGQWTNPAGVEGGYVTKVGLWGEATAEFPGGLCLYGTRLEDHSYHLFLE